eukprot:466304-Lingulodinium_polyedra.AAC.1
MREFQPQQHRAFLLRPWRRVSTSFALAGSFSCASEPGHVHTGQRASERTSDAAAAAATVTITRLE